MIKTVCFDMDNTLIETQALYEEARALLAPYIQTFGDFKTSDILEKLTQEEIALYDVYGYGRHMLPHAYTNTLLHFRKDATAAETAHVSAIANDVYKKTAAPKQGAMEAVRTLSQFVNVCLITVGDEEVQKKRIDLLSCKDAFHRVFIVAKKDSDTYRMILAQMNTQPDEAVMIGDSLKSDIIPAVEAGMEGILIPANNWVAREMKGMQMPETGARKLANITQAAEEICARCIKQVAKPARNFKQRKFG